MVQVERSENVAGVSGSSMSSEGLLVSAGLSQYCSSGFWHLVVVFILITFILTETEASFTLNLFPDGYSIGKPSEVCYKENQFMDKLVEEKHFMKK